jgi:uncharacterized phage-associated protein
MTDQTKPAAARTAPAVRSTLDVALWLRGRATSAGSRLSTQKLHRLLYLAQAEYGALNHGRKLMPATFVATEHGPVEPTVFHAFENGAPDLRVRVPAANAEGFLMNLWQQFGEHEAAELLSVIRSDGVFSATLEAEGRNAEISLEAMVNAYARRALGARAVPAPGVTLDALDRRARERDLKDRGLTPKSKPGEKEYWTADGRRAVKWVPGQKRY